jgi:hypothetical protein
MSNSVSLRVEQLEAAPRIPPGKDGGFIDNVLFENQRLAFNNEGMELSS